MQILPEVRLVVDGVHISFRQLEALRAVAETGSQNRASKKLGIAVPVLHRYIKELEAKLGYELLSSTPRGTVLTRQGGAIVDAQKRFENRLKEAGNPVVACSPLFFNLVSEAVAAAEKSGYKIDIMLGDDGCSMADRIAECASGAATHGAFVSCVAHVTDERKQDGLISGREQGRIQQCAARVAVP